MGLGTGPAATDAITQYRKTSVSWDQPETVVNRPCQAMSRYGAEINRASAAGAGSSVDVMLLPTGYWCLEPYQRKYWTEKTVTQAGVIRASNWNLAPYLVEAPLWQSPVLTGVTADGSVGSPGDHFLHTRVGSGVDWSTNVLSAVPASPVLPTNNFPMDRVAAGKVVYPPNQGFSLRFHAPSVQLGGNDNLLTLILGGAANILAPAGAAYAGGQFAMSLGGSGLGTVWEKLAGGWKEVLKGFRWADQGAVAGRAHTIIAMPHRQDCLSLLSSSTDAAQAPGPRMYARSFSPPPPAPVHNVVRSRRPVVDYKTKDAMTGAGGVYVDKRRDLRIPFQVSVLQYPTTGTLLDLPFAFKVPLPTGTAITIAAETYLDAGTNVVTALLDGTTFAPIAANPDGTFPSNAGQSQYIVRFTLTGNGSNTPYVRGYTVYAQGAQVVRVTVPFGGGTLRHMSITGPDLDPSHESASFEIEDLKNELVTVRARARIHLKVKTQYDPDPSKTCVLFEGESARVEATKTKGRATRKAGFAEGGATVLFPSAEWRKLSVPCVSMWARLSDQLSFAAINFGIDIDNLGNKVGTEYVPSKVTSVIKWLFQQAGVATSLLDIPDWPIRLYSSGNRDSTEYIMPPTAGILEWIQKLAYQYLGGYIVWDPNCGLSGLWRLKAVPQPPYTPLAHFSTDNPVGVTGKLQGQAYPALTWPIYEMTSWVKPPEANLIIVTATGELLPNGAGASQRFQWFYNPKSFDLDPAHPTSDPNSPDFLGRMVPLTYYNSQLLEQAEINFITRRLAVQTCYAQKWIHIEAPLALINDPNDAKLGSNVRPLRVYDPITINGVNCLVRNANPGYKSDRDQRMEMQCLMTDDGVSP